MSEPIDDAALVDRFPWVQIDHDTKHMFRGWLDRQLLINRCDDCGQFHHPPKPICPECWSRNLTPTEVSGRGVIHLAMFLRLGAPAPDVDYQKGPHPVVTIEKILVDPRVKRHLRKGMTKKELAQPWWGLLGVSSGHDSHLHIRLGAGFSSNVAKCVGSTCDTPDRDAP